MKLSLHALKTIPKAVIRGAQAKSPEILAGLAIAGVVLVVVESIKAGPEVKEAIDEANEDLSDLEEHGELTKDAKRKVLLVAAKRIGFAIVPAFVAAFLTIACIVGSLYFNNKQKAVLVAAATVSENQLQEYKDKVKELFGERKASQVEEEIHSEHLRAAEGDGHPTIIETGRGSDLIWDEVLGSYVRSSVEDYRRGAVDMTDYMKNEANADRGDYYWPTVAEFMDRLGIDMEYRPKGCNRLQLVPDKGSPKDAPTFHIRTSSHCAPYDADRYVTAIDYDVEDIDVYKMRQRSGKDREYSYR